MKTKKVGEINEIVISLLNLSLKPSTPIFIGQTNIDHIIKEHPEDFAKYGDKLNEILSDPDYVAKHPKKESVEYIKVYFDEEKEERVLVAVRATNNGIFYARSLFIMAEEKVKKYEEKKAFHKYKK